MKKCPLCSKIHDNSWGVCFACGTKLENTSNTLGDHSDLQDSDICKDPTENFKLSVSKDQSREKQCIQATFFSVALMACGIIIGIVFSKNKIMLLPAFLMIGAGFYYFAKCSIISHLYCDWANSRTEEAKKELFSKIIIMWRKRGVLILKDFHHYKDKISLYDTCLCIAHSVTSIQTIVALIAINENDFMEKGLSIEETSVKWYPVLVESMDKKGMPYRDVLSTVEEVKNKKGVFEIQEPIDRSLPKYCPKCGKGYDKSWKICLSCSRQLIDNMAQEPGQGKAE